MPTPVLETSPFSELIDFPFTADDRDPAADALVIAARTTALLAAVADDNWDRPVSESAVPGAPPWTLRDHVGHLADWNDEASRYIQPLLDGTGGLPADDDYDGGDFDGWNERRRPCYAQHPPAELRTWLAASADRLLGLARRLPPAVAATPAVHEWVWHNLTSHPVEHLAPAEAIDRP